MKRRNGEGSGSDETPADPTLIGESIVRSDEGIEAIGARGPCMLTCLLSGHHRRMSFRLGGESEFRRKRRSDFRAGLAASGCLRLPRRVGAGGQSRSRGLRCPARPDWPRLDPLFISALDLDRIQVASGLARM